MSLKRLLSWKVSATDQSSLELNWRSTSRAAVVARRGVALELVEDIVPYICRPASPVAMPPAMRFTSSRMNWLIARVYSASNDPTMFHGSCRSNPRLARRFCGSLKFESK